MSWNVSAIFPAIPVHEPGKRTDRSPSRIVCRLARIAASSGDETWPSPRPEPLLPTLASTSGGGTVALALEADDDLGLLLFMLFSRRWKRPHLPCRHSYHRARDIRISR